MAFNYFKLDESGDPVPSHFIEWAEWMRDNDDKRILKRSEIGTDKIVSTVFLGMNHNYGPGEPLIYETMIFGGPHDEYQERYSTKAQALAGHERAVKLAEQPPKQEQK